LPIERKVNAYPIKVENPFRAPVVIKAHPGFFPFRISRDMGRTSTSMVPIPSKQPDRNALEWANTAKGLVSDSLQFLGPFMTIDVERAYRIADIQVPELRQPLFDFCPLPALLGDTLS